MADKLSSPSSSSNSGSNHTPPKNGPSRDDDGYLVIRKQPPIFAFLDEPIDVLVGLEVARLTGDSPAGSEVELTASVRIQQRGDAGGGDRKHAHVAHASVALLNQPNTVTTNSKPCRLRCKIRMRESLRRDIPVYCLISIGARDPSHGVAPVTTIPIQLVNYKLRIAIDSNWSNIWYKDEGGRDKSMEAVAELYSKENAQHRERVPLRLTLYYASTTEGVDPVKVTNQEILRSLGSSSKLYTDKSAGKATIRFRIEDVSKNHQGQDFLLQIAPDYRKGFHDVAPGFTPSVSVRSKRNKRQRGSSSITSGRAEKRGASPVQHGDTATSGRPFGEHSQRSVWGPEGLTTTDPTRLREAMQGIVHWTEEVVNGLYPLQWQILGYAQHPDGTPDYTRPHYSMNNPNALISRVLAMYSESTRENLWILSQAVEQAGGSSQMQPPGNRDAYGRRSPDDSYSVPSAHSSHRGPPQPPAMPPPHGTPPVLLPAQQAAAMAQVSVQSGMHPSIASEAFRPKPREHHRHHPHQPAQPHHLMPFTSPPPPGRAGPHGLAPQQHGMPQQFYRRPMPTQTRRLEEQDSSLLPEPYPPPPIRAGVAASPPESNRMARQGSFEESGSTDHQSRESEVEYVLAKEYKALRTGERLGFPAYSTSREILGFYRESRSKVGVGEFTPISQHSQDFGPLEIMQASEILGEAIAKKSSAVHALKDWGTIANLIDHALVYDWTKDIGSSGGTGNSHSGSEGE
ncbi:expressed unknown protein [Seminavis robusta]|uniref:Uncharacterized protein n=1 Tax=Seminavis robusta TaxID=568900 RepID=A0A9N8HQN5_9STRA|nr:expressed unknown protein [Seminavis robusta]|eukprot:Sro1002_g229900.1 n/a (740) ;mRNA; r:30168-32387